MATFEERANREVARALRKFWKNAGHSRTRTEQYGPCVRAAIFCNANIAPMPIAEWLTISSGIFFPITLIKTGLDLINPAPPLATQLFSLHL